MFMLVAPKGDRRSLSLSPLAQFLSGATICFHRLVLICFIKFTNGKEILVKTAWRWEWERVLKYASS
ncbi:hypothetical protein H6G91_36125 [Nostoc muscorum FACHB-395]|nr:hypothetical protein [Desmonostoc muscorum FACHB-395]